MTEEQTEVVRLHMRDTYDVAHWEWDSEELGLAIYELITKEQAKNNDALDLVINRLFELERFDLDPQFNGEFTELERRIESTGEYVSWRSIRTLISEIRKENGL